MGVIINRKLGSWESHPQEVRGLPGSRTPTWVSGCSCRSPPAGPWGRSGRSGACGTGGTSPAIGQLVSYWPLISHLVS